MRSRWWLLNLNGSVDFGADAFRPILDRDTGFANASNPLDLADDRTDRVDEATEAARLLFGVVADRLLSVLLMRGDLCCLDLGVDIALFR